MKKIDSEEVRDKLITARVGLLLRHSFFGNLATRMKLVVNNEIPTAATDFRNIFYNESFINNLSIPEVTFVVAHEILHCAFEHFIRRENRIPFLWNVAGDFIINGILVRARIGTMPEMGLFNDDKYNGWSSEQVYDDLFKMGEDAVSKLGKLLDEHMDMSSDPDKDSLSDMIREAVLQAHSASPNSTPTEIQRIIKEFTEPKISWRDLLQQRILSILQSDYTWTRPSRKSWNCPAVLPGMLRENAVDLCIAIDTSGSIGEQQLKDFLGEVVGITQEFKDFTIKLWSFDTSVHAFAEYNSGNVDELLDYVPGGGGGTAIDCNWEFMIQEGIEPSRFILFTDAYDGNGNRYEQFADYAETVWIIHENPTFVPTFGVYAIYDANV